MRNKKERGRSGRESDLRLYLWERRLTASEERTAQWVAKGLDGRQIAQVEGITEDQSTRRLLKIREKLDVWDNEGIKKWVLGLDVEES